MSNQKSLFIALLIIVLIFFVELAGGFISNSIALLSDAGHMLTDAMALALALLATIFAARPATRERTFGFYRLEILSALFNGSLLSLISIYIFYESFQRFLNPVAIKSDLLLIIAAIGLLANIGAAAILAGKSKENLNVRGAFIHVLSDMGSSAAVIVGGLLIRYLNWYYIDPVLGALIAVLILRGALGLLSDSVNILLEAAPEGVRVEEVAASIKSVKGVKDLHDLHVWAITSGMNAVSAHVIIDDAEVKRAPEILKEINEKLKEKYQITHSTFQTECASCPEGLICRIEPVERKHEHEH